MTHHDVCATVVSDLQFDARAWKEARSLTRAGYRVVLIGCRYDLRSTVRRTEDGIDVVEVPLGSRLGRRNPIRRAYALVRLWWETAQTPARIYHCHNVHPAPAAWFASRIRHSGLIYDAHELYGESTRRSVSVRLRAAIAWSLEAWMVRHSDVVVTTNPSRAAELIRRHGKREVVVLANVPARVDSIQPLDPGFPKIGRILLYQGGIYAGRAFEETIRALVALEDFHFVILGFGRESVIANLSQYAEAHGVRDRLTFLPPRPFSQLVNTAAGATVGIVPVHPNDFSDYTGDTNKLFEYLMAGLPVVVSDLPEMRRVVESGDVKIGELFDPASPATIVAAVRRVVDDPADYGARRREARRLALEKYNWEIEEVKLLGAYSTLASRPGSTTVRKPI